MPIASYSTAPFTAWAGWRLRVPGGPAGGQFHGFIAPDDLVDDAGGWPQGHDEIFRPIDTRQNLGIYPWHGWDPKWHGSVLLEGQTVSDYVYRSPAEVRPRPNASGGINVVRAVQLERTPGFAVAPGNYHTLGAAPAIDQIAYHGPPTGMWPRRYPVDRMPGSSGGPAVCPAWGCGPPPWTMGPDANTSPRPAPTVTQPPPPITPMPAPVTPMGPGGTNGCAPGQYRDAVGNCTADWRYPYPVNMPMDANLAPSPTVAASTCPSGYTQDPTTGNCLSPGVCPTGYVVDPSSGACVLSSAVSATPGTGIMAWLSSSTPIAGVNVPHWALAAGFGLVALRFMGGRRR